jgi:hypothetical protein
VGLGSGVKVGGGARVGSRVAVAARVGGTAVSVATTFSVVTVGGAAVSIAAGAAGVFWQANKVNVRISHNRWGLLGKGIILFFLQIEQRSD